MCRGRGEARSVLLDEQGSASPDLEITQIFSAKKSPDLEIAQIFSAKKSPDLEIAQIFSAKLLLKDKLSSDWSSTSQ